MYLVNKWPVSATGDRQFEPKMNSMWLRSISHITITPVIILPFFKWNIHRWPIGSFPYLFVMIFPQIITLICTLLCFCYVLIEVIFAPDFATVTLVILASNHLCYSLSETIFILCPLLGYNAVQTVATMDKCEICSRKFQSHSHQIQCCVCLNAYHMKCISSRPEDLQKLTNVRNEWYCPTCLSNIFPCNFIEDENDF